MSEQPFGRLAVIADPAADGGRVGGRLLEVQRALEGRGLDYVLEVGASPADLTALATEALDGGARFVVAVGDDGSIQDVVNGMFRDGKPIVHDAVLGVVPAGATCDLVTTFSLPSDPAGAVAHLIGDNTYPLDLIKIAATGPAGERSVVRYAHNLAGVGLHADAWRRADSMPEWLGGGRRFLGFWASYLAHRTGTLLVRTETKEHQLQAWSLVVANGQFTDGGTRLSPRSYPGDGVLDALAFIGPKSDAYRMLPRIFRHGAHVPDPNIRELRVKLTLSVTSPRPLAVVADGRALGTTPVSFQVVPQQIALKL